MLRSVEIPLMLLALGAALAASSGSAVSSTTGSGYAPVPARVGDVPHHAGVYYISSNFLTGDPIYNFECSGAVIGPSYVITTARCARDASALMYKVAVTAGTVSRLDNNNVYVNVSEIIQHEDYDPSTKANNIALLKLVSNFEVTAILSSVSLSEGHVITGSLCSISGWTKDILTIPQGLSYGNLTVFDQSLCQTSPVEGAVCVGVPEEERVGCLLGDEGSPIVCHGLLTGLLHYNVGSCFTEPRPSVVTDIAAHTEWVREKMGGATDPTAAATTTITSTTTTTAPPDSVYDSKVAVVGDVPYQAAVWSVHSNPLTGGLRYDFECAGSVVDKEFILTSVSCVESVESSSLAVSAGFVSRYDASIRHMNVTEIIKHGGFNVSTREHDVAILRITPGFSVSSNLSIIPLQDVPVSTGTLCRISGWRQDVMIVGASLRFAGASVFDCDEASRLEGGGRSGKLCAGIPESETFRCLLGDEGGPLMCDGQLSGVLSYSASTCLPGRTPGSYIDVASHKQWILEAVTGGSGSSDATTITSTERTTLSEASSTSSSSDTTTTTTTPGTTTLIETTSTTGVLPGGGGGSALSFSVGNIVVLLCASLYRMY